MERKRKGRVESSSSIHSSTLPLPQHSKTPKTPIQCPPRLSHNQKITFSQVPTPPSNILPIQREETPKPAFRDQSHRLSASSLSGEVRLELRRLSDFRSLAVTRIRGSLAASTRRAGRGLVVLVASAAAGAGAGGTLVCDILSVF